MEKLIIFGAGEGGKKVASILIGSLNYEIIAFADNNPVKQKKSIFGIPIIGPKGFFSQKFDRIIISSIYAKDIYIQLIDLGIPEKKLVVMFLDHSKPLDEQLRSAGLTIENSHRCKNIDSLSETKVVIWGTDHNAIKAWAEICRSDKIYINNFISENKNVIGNLLFDVKIISPQQLSKSKYDWIINTSLKNEELKYRLSEYGITSKNLIDWKKEVRGLSNHILKPNNYISDENYTENPIEKKIDGVIAEFKKSYREQFKTVVKCSVERKSYTDQFIDNVLKIIQPAKVLAIGDDNSYIVRKLLSYGIESFGAHTDLLNVIEGKKIYPNRIELINGTKLPYDRNSFETVICNGLIHHLSSHDLTTFLSEIHRITKTDAFILIPKKAETFDQWEVIGETREWWEDQFLEEGFRRHPLTMELIPFQKMENEGDFFCLAFKKITKNINRKYPLSLLRRNRDLHMDMLRESGRRSDAHLARYSFVKNYVRPNDVIIDSACGLGYGSAILWDNTECSKVIGLDCSDFAIKYAKRVFGESRNGLEFIRSDIEVNQFKNNSFDCIVSFETLEHLVSPELFLKNVEANLKPGGKFICSVPNMWIDKDGNDPSPYHFHVFDIIKILEICKKYFLIDQVFTQSAGGHKTRFFKKRRFHEFQGDDDDIRKAEWWIVVCIKDPIGAECIPYKETVFPKSKKSESNITQYIDDYINPWIVHTMVHGRFRVKSRNLLSEISKSVIKLYPFDSTDVGAALCIIAYAELNGYSENGYESVSSLMENIKKYITLTPKTAHMLRWQISLRFALAHLELLVGNLLSAEKIFRQCINGKFMEFGPHLGTKNSEAAFYAGWLAFLRNDKSRAIQDWNDGINLIKKLKHASIEDLLVNPDVPAQFQIGDGLREITIIFDNITKCVNCIRYLKNENFWSNFSLKTLMNNFQNSLAEVLSENDHRGGEIVALRDRLNKLEKDCRLKKDMINRLRNNNNKLNHFVKEYEHKVDSLESKPRQSEMNCLELYSEPNEVKEDAFAWMIRTNCKKTNYIKVSNSFEDNLISVIIPVYNQRKYLADAVESVWHQNIDKARFEIILADDGSTDGSYELALDMKRNSPVLMKILTHEHHINKGVSSTRNLCIENSRGEYIALLDADDKFHPERLGATHDFLSKNKMAGAVCSLGFNIDQEGNLVRGFNGSKIAGDYKNLSDKLNPPYTFQQLWDVYPIANSSITLRRSTMEKVGGYPEVMAHQAEDWLLMLKVSLETPINCIDKKLVYYRNHAESYTDFYHYHNFHRGARLEVLYHLVHWMIHQPKHRDFGIKFFRENYPMFISQHLNTYSYIEDYLMKNPKNLFDFYEFENFLKSTFSEISELRKLLPIKIRQAMHSKAEIRRLNGIIRKLENENVK